MLAERDGRTAEEKIMIKETHLRGRFIANSSYIRIAHLRHVIYP